MGVSEVKDMRCRALLPQAPCDFVRLKENPMNIDMRSAAVSGEADVMR